MLKKWFFFYLDPLKLLQQYVHVLLFSNQEEVQIDKIYIQLNYHLFFFLCQYKHVKLHLCNELTFFVNVLSRILNKWFRFNKDKLFFFFFFGRGDHGCFCLSFPFSCREASISPKRKISTPNSKSQDFQLNFLTHMIFKSQYDYKNKTVIGLIFGTIFGTSNFSALIY